MTNTNSNTLPSTPSPLWGGRFTEAISEVAHRFSSGIEYDSKLWREDIRGSIAHARMLGSQSIISKEEAAAIVAGLEVIASEVERDEFQFDDSMEDVHLAIEQRLTEKIGAAGGKLHTGRSRNDQIGTDERLYLKSAVPELAENISEVIGALLEKAEEYSDAIMPGYTHLQRAQPVLLSHHLLAYVEMLARDGERLDDLLRRVDRSPLGAAAFAGTSYPIDREMTARELGFGRVGRNSIDAVSDRDYLIELTSACSIIMMHLSRMAEELILWSTREFGFVTMSDKVTTGSSIMPQKRNPDMAELIRGKVGRVYGALIALLTMMKGLPLAYNRDMQEDKPPMFEALETTGDSLEMMAVVLRETTFNRERMEAAVRGGDLMATELADYLARKGLPFREAHHIAGQIVASAEARTMNLDAMPLQDYRAFSELFEADIFEYLDPWRSVREKKSIGSTNPEMVREAVRAAVGTHHAG
ncbi:MAG TPA: argininosuccinate lyase [Candidatus Kapabacteria bacterium]|nr:argininosuccinate lyase [Candidatus Kapabacteria bacterium]